MVAVRIEGFENHDFIVFFKDLGHVFETIDDIGGLVVPFQPEIVGAGHNCHPCCIDPLGRFDSRIGNLFKLADGVRAAQRIEWLRPFGMSHKDSHVHFELIHGFGELVLKGIIAAHHSIVFPCRKALVGSEFELVNICGGMVSEHSEVGRIVERKFFDGFHGFGVGLCCNSGNKRECGCGFEKVAPGCFHLWVILGCLGDWGQVVASGGGRSVPFGADRGRGCGPGRHTFYFENMQLRGCITEFEMILCNL